MGASDSGVKPVRYILCPTPMFDKDHHGVSLAAHSPAILPKARASGRLLPPDRDARKMNPILPVYRAWGSGLPPLVFRKGKATPYSSEGPLKATPTIARFTKCHGSAREASY